MVNILAKNAYFFPNPQILEPSFFPFFVSEKFVIFTISVIIFIWVLSIKYWVGGDDFLSKSWKKRSWTLNIFDMEWGEELRVTL